MKIYTGFEQRSLEWNACRAGIVTASEADAIVSPTFEIRKGLGVTTYLAQKVAEWWTGGSLPQFQTLDMEIGNIQESEAIPFLTFEYGWKIERPAFIASDDLNCGCSPDGMCGDFGIEIKCPGALNQTKYLIYGTLPPEYAVQVHFSMFVTGMASWKFLSYRRGFPPMLLTVERDERVQAVIKDALGLFLERFSAMKNKMVELNDGVPPNPNAFREAVLKQQTAPQPEIVDYRH